MQTVVSVTAALSFLFRNSQYDILQAQIIALEGKDDVSKLLILSIGFSLINALAGYHGDGNNLSLGNFNGHFHIGALQFRAFGGNKLSDRKSVV